MPAVIPYAAVLALLFVWLSVRTIRARRNFRVAIGDAGDIRVIRPMRVQANFAEYVPFALLLIHLLDASGAPSLLVHGAGVCLVAGRFSHAWGVSQPVEQFGFRVFGMALTLGVILAAACVLLGIAARSIAMG